MAKTSKVGTHAAELLQEIRDNFEYCVRYWQEIRDEGDKDMRHCSGDPWEEKDKAARKDAGRPCVAFDELGQYCNQLINDVRQNKRAVKVDPTGAGANEKTSEFRANLIRQIEYASKAQAVYSGVMENVTQRSYGYARVSKRYIADDSFDQELVILPIQNPNSVWIDPDCKQRDRSDMEYAFIVDSVRKKDFAKRWPKAQITNFSTEMIQAHPLWVKDDFIQVAEYWRVEKEPRTLLSINTDAGAMHVFADELEDAVVDNDSVTIPKAHALPDGIQVPKGKHELLNSRESHKKTVVQYITNGVEILEENPQDGQYVPIGCCFGKEKYIDSGGGSKLVIESLIRLARDAYMAYCFTQTAGLELVGMMPKALWTAYEGQFEGHEDEWKNANRSPIPFLQAKAKTEATGEEILPLPTWNHWDAPLQAVEVQTENFKRAIQSALGMYNTSVGKHDTNAQSGVAVRALDDQSSQGSFHFIDNFDGFLEHIGRILDDLIDSTYDSVRDVGTRSPSDEHKLVHINEHFKDPTTGEEYHYAVGSGRHSVSITTGPSSTSQRDAASTFADNLAQNQVIFPRIADLVVKLKDLGPIGDEIAKRLTPPDIAQQQAGQEPLPPAAQAKMTQQQQQLIQQAQVIQELQAQIAAKMPEVNAKIQIAGMQEDTKRQEVQAQLRIAELQAGVQASVAKLETLVDSIQHTLGLQNEAADRAHELTMAQQQQQHDAQQAQQAQQADAQQATQAQQASAQAAQSGPQQQAA